MSNKTANMLHFEGTFVGIFSTGVSISSLGIYDFKEIGWDFLDITIDKRFESRNIQEERVLDSWYSPIINPADKLLSLKGHKAEIILRHPQFGKYSNALYDVIITGFTGDRPREFFPIRAIDPAKEISPGSYKASGRIRFSIPDPTVQTIVRQVPENEVTPAKIEVVQTQIEQPIKVIIEHNQENGVLTGADDTTVKIPEDGQTNGNQTTQTNSGCWPVILWSVVGAGLMFLNPWVGLATLAYGLSRFNPGLVTNPVTSGRQRISFISVLLLAIAAFWIYSAWGKGGNVAYILLFTALLHLFSLSSQSGIWRFLTGLILFLTVIGLAYQFLPNLREWAPQPDNKRSSVRIRSTTKTPSPKPGGIDSLYDHEMSWEDFIPKHYEGTYPTTLSSFQQSAGLEKSLSKMEPPRDPATFWKTIYQALNRNDQPKLDSLITIFRTSATENGLSPSATAEMIVSYIQHIPYVLVHDESCQQAVQKGNDFIRDYHLQGRPCMAEVPAGVQSPYAFAHNLKGDCDTRSLLAFSILSALKIPCSIWVSETYGHSVIGIGLAAGGSNFKYAGTTRHFGTELTNTGFRIGMLAPDNTDMDNWNIVLQTRF